MCSTMADMNGAGLRMVFRSEWGAAPAEEERLLLMKPATYVVHTFTDTEACYCLEDCCEIVKQLQAKDIASKLGDIRYNFVIGSEGTVFIGRGWEAMPPLNPKHREFWEDSLEIAHIGPEGFPSDSVMDSANELLRRGVKGGYLIEKVRYVMEFNKEEQPHSNREADEQVETKEQVSTKEREIVYE